MVKLWPLGMRRRFGVDGLNTLNPKRQNALSPQRLNLNPYTLNPTPFTLHPKPLNP